MPRIKSLPRPRRPVVQVATPAESATAEQPPIDVPLEVKLTVPVGEEPVTRTVNVTNWPAIVEYFDESIESDVVAGAGGVGAGGGGAPAAARRNFTAPAPAWAAPTWGPAPTKLSLKLLMRVAWS